MTAVAPHTLVRRMFFVGVALVVLLSGTSLASTQADGWPKPVPLSSDSTISWFPDVAVDLSGKVHVVWSSGTTLGVGESYDTVMYASREDSGDWSSPVDIVALSDTGEVTRPALYADPAGMLHMTYRSFMLYYSHAPAEAVDARSLLPPRSISHSNHTGYFSRVVEDAEGRLHLVYSEYAATANCPQCLHLFYRFSVDGGLSWSYPVDISQIDNGAAKPQILVDSKQILHVVWEAGSGGNMGQLAGQTTVMYTASGDGGRTWRSATQLAPIGTGARNIAIGKTGTDRLVTAWLDLSKDLIYYQTSDDHGITWTVPQAIPGVFGAWSVYTGPTDDYSMATDSAGIVHLLAVGRTSPTDRSLSLLHITWDGVAWSTPEVIVTLFGDVPEWPRASIGLGNRLHVVWFVRDQAHVWGGAGVFRYRVWYSQKRLNSPSIDPVFWPTMTPTSSRLVQSDATAETSVPPVVSTPPPVPTPGPLDQVVPPANSENQALLAILTALAPVFILLSVVMFAAYRRRR